MRLKRVLSDAGADSEANHVLARRDVGVRSYIKAGVGRRGPGRRRAATRG